MSTRSVRNLRGIHVRRRNAAGEIIPEPAIAEGDASPNGLFAQTFLTIAEGLYALPENIVAAVRALPERFFPPSWVFWQLVHVIKQVAVHRRAWEFVRANCPIRCFSVERRGWRTEPASIESDECECTVEIAGSQAAASVHRRDLEYFVRIPLRMETVSASEVVLHAWEDFVPLPTEELVWRENDERLGVAGERLQEFVPEAYQDDLLEDLRAMQLVGGDGDSVTAIRDYDSVVLDLCRRLEDPQWQRWVAALAGDWFLLENLATAANDQELLAEARRRTDLCVRTWLTDPKHMMADWAQLGACSDWRPYVLRMIYRRGQDHFRQRVQPYLRDLRWVADWGGSLLGFCDESWRPDLLRTIERLLNTSCYGVAMACVDRLLQEPANVDAVMQKINDTGILDAQRWEDLAFLLMAHAPHLAMPVIESALQGNDEALMPFLAVVDTEWSRRLLQGQLQDPRQRDPMKRLRLLTALSHSADKEVVRAAKRSLSELSGLRGRRSVQNWFKHVLESIRAREHDYASSPAGAGDHLSSVLTIYLTSNDEEWAMSAATGQRLLDRLVADRFAEVAPAEGPQP